MIDTLRRLAHRTAAFVRRDPLDRELDSELASHLAMAEDEHVRRGRSPEEARRLARVELGGYDAAVERHRDARGLPTLDAVTQDLRYAMRSLRREPGFAAIAIAILALGIGANTAVFSIVNALVLRPLPFRDADRLVWITQASETEGLSAQTYPVAAYQAFRHENQSLEDLTAYFAFFGYMDFALASGNQAEHVSGVYLVPRFFELLGVSPARGRLFVPEEVRPNGRAAAIISDALWHRRFGGDPAVVGRTVTLNNAPITIVGVLPEDFDFASVFSPGARVDLFMPAPLDTMKDWGNTLALVGRLKPGITTDAAASEFAALGPRIEKLQPALQGRTHAQVSALKAHVSGSMRPMLVVLWAAVAFVLLIVCANLASLLIARTAARTREIAVRMALGAGRGRLLRQMVAEGVLLSLAGAAAGIPLAFALTAYVKSAVVTSIPLLAQVRVDGVALIATATIAIVTGVVIGAIPGMRVSAGSMSAALKEQGRGTTDSRWHHRLRSGLVVGEIALASMLLVGAGLLMRSFVALMSENFGFRPERVVEVRVDLPQGISDDQRSAFAEEIARRAAAVPGVAQAAITDALPLDRNRQWGLGRVGSQRKDDGVSVFLYVIGPGYFGTMGIPLTAGRDFSAADRAKTLPVAIISKSAARALWPGQDPIGRHVTTGAEVEVDWRRRRRTADEPGGWSVGAVLPAVHAGGPRWPRARGAHSLVSRERRAGCPRRAHAAGSDYRHDRVPADRAAGGARLVAAALPPVVGRWILAHGAGPRVSRHLRCRFVQRRAATAGDRRADGTGRDVEGHQPRGAWRYVTPGGRGRCAWHRGGGDRRPPDFIAALRHLARGSADVSRKRGGARAGRAGGGGAAGAGSGACRADERAAQRVTAGRCYRRIIGGRESVSRMRAPRRSGSIVNGVASFSNALRSRNASALVENVPAGKATAR